MAIFHIAYHGYRQKPSQEQFEEFAGMLSAYFAAAPYIEDGAAGRYAGPAEDGFHDAAWVKFNSVDDYAVHMRSPHGEDEATHLKETVARVRSFDIITPDEPADTAEKLIDLYKERWELFPDVAKVLREDVDAHFPYL
ncbi:MULTISPECIES: hypothetical protein [Mycolicibacterium]|uniref:Antibiotic biosynthesis monooxygenase n=2 Tax=Mycolicibacterium TaxID=1866885 RepID=A0A1A0W7E5_MYCPR|nr:MULTISPECIES: hypothetical protein [Mycolicibacterium]NKZ10044.1 hypothetical protein [Mycolicibacterium septicum DSM 44393]OBB91944.1 hypothetical protein A5779_22795 [Mycolicibacterium peregrinum]